MSFPKQIYKAYDIRGIYPEELDEDIAYRTGRAFAELLKQETPDKELSVVVSNDMRQSSPSLKEKIIDGITDQGVNVVDIGMASTPTFYFAISHFSYDGGLQVSASHNPAQYNGFKMTRRKARAISGESGIMDIRDMAEANNFKKAKKAGKVTMKEGVVKKQVEFALEQVDVSKIKPLQIVVDAANSVGAMMMEELFAHLPCNLVKLYFDLDGTFPNHEADPLKDENNHDLQQKVLAEEADLGIALDGDGDRIFIVDNNGKTVEQAIVRGILAKIFLADNPGATICYDIRPGKITEDMIVANGGKPVVTKVGHSLIKEKALEEKAIFAGESSGHFFVHSNGGFFEAPCVVAVKLLEEFSQTDKSVSEYIVPLQKYYHSGEINFSVEDKQAVFDRLREKYSDNLKYDFDGLTFEFKDYWFNVRASNTENKVRLNLEARDDKIMSEKTEEVRDSIQNNI